MVILDVLIIGGGPHALTLATLLSHPDPDPKSDPGHVSPLSLSLSLSDPARAQTNSETSNNKRCRGKKKKRATTGLTFEECLAKSTLGRADCPPLSLRVVDSYGEWTTLWESQFTTLNIPHLRSHTLVHTDPLNKKALQEFVLKLDRSAELHSLPDQVYILDENAFFNDMRLGKKERKRLNIASTLKKSLSFSLPGTKLSVDFFKDQWVVVNLQVERYNLDKVLVKGTVEYISPVLDDEEKGEEETEWMKEGDDIRVTERKKVKYFVVKLQEGIKLKARQVVMATGPTRAQMANIPSWVKSIGESYPEERLQHTVHLMHHLSSAKQQLKDDERQNEAFHSQGQRVMVVGGLTSAHVVSIALQQGASHVTWVMRKHPRSSDSVKLHSLVGRYSHVEHGIKMDGQAYLRQFYNARSLHKRQEKEGPLPPRPTIHLQPFILSGRVDVKTYCQVSEASWCYRSQAWSLSLSTGAHWSGDMIWLATLQLDVIDGWPCISESLKWTEGCPLYLMGQYTALQVGPHAVNLAGGQAASIRIAKDIMRVRNSTMLMLLN
ncbi:hypothetical protein F7725_026501 [Dissostichus mawsoni]|uniref:FAD/NAD(P)-binding domain-containing protein n=1 Tax=Dissostichus mawsoni TaxID=36200 RepID=A0A7J5X759_DISMA|nr:hypothetical protein F7725_026501 [Dissostichus mawsoni]